jgi:hypothetical protein
MVIGVENHWFLGDHPRNLFQAPNTGKAQYFFPRIFLIRVGKCIKKSWSFPKMESSS